MNNTNINEENQKVDELYNAVDELYTAQCICTDILTEKTIALFRFIVQMKDEEYKKVMLEKSYHLYFGLCDDILSISDITKIDAVIEELDLQSLKDELNSKVR